MLDFRQLLTVPFLTLTFFLNAQETVTSSGLNASGSGGSIAYSVGQVNVDQNIGSNGSILQGVQQPYEIYTVGDSEVPGINLNLTVHPNPTSDQVFLTLEDSNIENLSYRLVSSKGKIFLNKAFDESMTTIPLNSYPSDTYLLTIINNQFIVKTFRIIKN